MQEGSLNRTELKNKVAERAEVSAADADRAIDAVIGAITDALVDGDKVSLPGFGIFETRSRAARTGRNPQTGEALEIAASTSAAFKPGAELKRKLAKA
nr:HU family DNA-binding protein [Knoellia sinensis]